LFHITKITPISSNEISTKRVILYEPGDDDKITAKSLSDTLRPTVVQTITDNIVKNPRTYNIEAIVPFQPIGRYISEGIKTISDMIVSLSDMLGGGNTPEGVPYGFDGSLSSVFALLQTANTAAEFAGKLPGTDGVSFINMNSLEAMADSCRTLCMKMWTGYEYKYVTIVGMNYDKDPKEDSVYRGTLTLQEVPVLAITKPNALKENVIDRNWAVKAISAVQGALTVPLLNITGVRNAAGGGESDVDMIKGTLGV
jgi:hypothetical protein